MLNYKMLVVVLLLVPIIQSRVILPEHHASLSDRISANREFGLPLNVQDTISANREFRLPYNVQEEKYLNDITPNRPEQGMVNIILKAICSYHRRVRTTPFPSFCFRNF